MIIRPRLNDHHNLFFRQEDVGFAIPFLDEDIPLYIDPFLLWKSPSQQDNSLHTTLINSFNFVGQLFLKDENAAIEILIKISECNEVGLGVSKNKQGKRIGENLAYDVLGTFKNIPQIYKRGFTHFEEIQLLVNNFSKDRVSDIAANFLKSFLIDYTIQNCQKHNIPSSKIDMEYFNTKKGKIVSEKVDLPSNPTNNMPILLVPKRWLRAIPWLNFEDYFKHYISTSNKLLSGQDISRIEVLEYNRKNYDLVQGYVKTKKLEQKNCQNDPLFTQIPILSSKRKLNTILKLPTGKIDNSDQKYENNLSPLLASMLYPEMDFAQIQSRTDSGVLIRDLIFYNNTSEHLLKEIYELYGSKQIVFELKTLKK